jgi:hypothetical protein
MAARPLKILRKQLEAIVGPGDFRAIKQLEDLLRDVQQSSTLSVRSVTAAAAVLNDDDVVLASGTFSVTLPVANNSVGRMITVKNIGVGTVTVVATGSDTIDGAASYPLSLAYESVTVVGAGGGAWVIV